MVNVTEWQANVKFTNKRRACISNFCLSIITMSHFELIDPKKLNHTPVSTVGSSQPVSRPLQPIQPAPPLQPSGVPTSGPSQTTIHLLPTGKLAESLS